jgi:glycosyltransferase involved in cell wall biosynthesis
LWLKAPVSTPVPAYKAQEWIGDTLPAGIGQNWGRNQSIVVDDGSQDQILAIARRFQVEQRSFISFTEAAF